jgi:hypothetical protein
MKTTQFLATQVRESAVLGIALCIGLVMASCGTLDQGPDRALGEGPAESGLASEQGLLAPDGHSTEKGFFPLDIGNTWTYAEKFVVVVDDGPPSVTERRETRTMTGTEELSGHEYVVEVAAGFDENGDTLYKQVTRYRQDRAGLYEADIAAGQSPSNAGRAASFVRSSTERNDDAMARVWEEISRKVGTEEQAAYRRGWEDLVSRLSVIYGAMGRPSGLTPVLQGPPGGVLAGEITRLKYPLHPSQEWVVRDAPIYVYSTVESHDVLDLPPGKMNGYKLRIMNDALGPEDLVYYWYGRDGLLGFTVHVETVIVDPGGDPVGSLVVDENAFLESLDLLGKGKP